MSCRIYSAGLDTRRRGLDRAELGECAPELRPGFGRRQLDEPEVRRLSAFCQRLAKDGAPVIALADFSATQSM